MRKRAAGKAIWRQVCWTVGGLTFGIALLMLVSFLVLSSDHFLNGYLKPRLQRAFTAKHPGEELRVGHLHYVRRKNRLTCTSLTLSREGSLVGQVGACRLSGVHWASALLRKGAWDMILADARLEAHNFALTTGKSGYRLRCDELSASIPDSRFSGVQIDFQPAFDDEKFFSATPFRRTRIRVTAKRCLAEGVDWRGLLKGKRYAARSVRVEDALFDSFLDREKPKNPHPPAPFTPFEALQFIKKPVAIDTLEVNGQMDLSLRREAGAKPGVLTFGKVHVHVRDLCNQPGAARKCQVQANGDLMNATTLSISLALPLSSPSLSLEYEGSMGRMDLSKLNPYLETAGRVRVNSGTFEEGVFMIMVTDDHASGQVRTIYHDLDVTLLDKTGHDEGGLATQLESFVLDRVALRKENEPKKGGTVVLGSVNYTREPEERFFHFLWFALREGLFNVLGVPPARKR